MSYKLHIGNFISFYEVPSSFRFHFSVLVLHAVSSIEVITPSLNFFVWVEIRLGLCNVCYVSFFFHLPLGDANHITSGTFFFYFFTQEVFTQNNLRFFPRMDNNQ
jgi:hypothetical protein